MDQKAKIDQACRVAEDFTKLYYESVDKRRHDGIALVRVSRLLPIVLTTLRLRASRVPRDSASTLTWNGNGLSGNERIQKFYIDLPSSDHTVSTLDAQPVMDVAVNGQLSFLIQVSGNVKYQEKVPKSFQQSFIITAQGDKWKIVTDCFRLQEPLNTGDKN